MTTTMAMTVAASTRLNTSSPRETSLDDAVDVRRTGFLPGYPRRLVAVAAGDLAVSKQPSTRKPGGGGRCRAAHLLIVKSCCCVVVVGGGAMKLPSVLNGAKTAQIPRH
jgi:hypothetical protein